VSAGDVLLRAEGVRKAFGPIEVLKGVSVTLDRGQTKVVMGPSGTGKSTLLRCLNHLTPPDGGTIWLDGEEVTASRINRIRADIGFVFQDFNLFTHLRVLDNVRIGPVKIKRLPKAQATALAWQELRRVGLEDKAEAYPAELSGGQQQRASIARALAMQPKLILFDEPTSALDPELTGEVVRVMRQLADDGVTMLVVSHEMAFARAAADEIMFMDEGRIVEQGPPEKLFRSPEQRRTSEFLAVIAQEGPRAGS